MICKKSLTGWALISSCSVRRCYVWFCATALFTNKTAWISASCQVTEHCSL